MSESCPNCGSESTPDDVPSYACGSKDYFATPACELIRSLREELTKANAECAQLQKQRDDAFRIVELAKGLAAVERDAERDRCADWLRTQICDYPFEHRGTIQAIIAHICDNEHRSNT